jgi:hypothetical protein
LASIKAKLDSVTVTNDNVTTKLANIVKGMNTLNKTMQNMAKTFATKDDLEGIKKEVTEIKKLNETWMKEQMEKIERTIAEAESAATKCYQDGIEVVRETAKLEVAIKTETDLI